MASPHRCSDLLPSAAFAFAAVLAAPALAAPPTEIILHTFTGGVTDGRYPSPRGGLIADKEGNLYGTTSEGGGTGCGGAGCGTVFKITPQGVETILYAFSDTPDGNRPLSGVIADPSGNLYGTTLSGGAGDYGSVFKVTSTGAEKLLYSFSPLERVDGAFPYDGLLRDKAGNLYGTTGGGGTFGNGTVFQVTPQGAEKVLYSFAGGKDGAAPYAGVIMDAGGNLYGTTSQGGNKKCFNNQGCGTVYELSAGTEKILHVFAGGSDGANPYAGLLENAAGNFYGATTGIQDGNSFGTFFEITPAGQKTILYKFKGGVDGVGPLYSLVTNKSGNLFGAASPGGTTEYGTVFELSPPHASGAKWIKTTLYTFQGGNDGIGPDSPLLLRADSTMVGATEVGGASNFGILFAIKK